MAEATSTYSPGSEALIALHFQNDICHPQGCIPFSLDRSTGEAARFLEASRQALDAARRAGWTIAHMHIVFAEDYSDLLRNCRLFLKTETLGALKRGSWGASAFAGFEPAEGEIFVTGNGNSAFRRTDLEAQLRSTFGQPGKRHGTGDAVFGRAHGARLRGHAAITSGCSRIAAPRAIWRHIARRCTLLRCWRTS